MFSPRYEPDAHGSPAPGLDVRPATADDLPACGELTALREGGDPAVWAARLAVALGPQQALFVATVDGPVAGYGRVMWLTPEADGGRGAPDGWYLSGIVVAPAWRRRGLGRALTWARCAWVWERAEVVHVVTNETNRASVDLHRELGFRERSRDFALPGVTFTGGRGVLFSCTPSSRAEQVTQIGVHAAR